MGAAIGALATLCLHPVSRPFMTGVTSRASPAVLRGCIDSNAPSLPPPTTIVQASLWMQLAAHRILGHEKLSPKELSTVMAIAKAGAAKEQNNAFWPQMEAIFCIDGGDLAHAIEAWSMAANCQSWNDHQITRLMDDRAAIVDMTGVTQSWQLAYLYYARSDDVAYCLRAVARAILSNADYNKPDGLTKRYATLLNGELLRSHAHSSRSSISAMEIVDLTTSPSDAVALPVTPKTIWAGQDQVLRNLTSVLHQPDWAATAQKIFKENEAWRALTVHDSNAEQSELLALGTVLSSSVASAVIVVAVVGLFVWSIGRLVAWRLARAKAITPYVAAGIAISLGGLVEALTRYFPAAVAAALCAGFLIVAPDRSRKARPNDLGPMFGFTATLLGLICSSMFMIYLVGSTPAANAIFPNLGVPSDYFDKPLMAGLAAVSFGLVLLMAPIWAVVHRLGTPHVLALSLMRFGGFLAVMGLTLSIVLGPMAVYADRRLETAFDELVRNEPVYYDLHQ